MRFPTPSPLHAPSLARTFALFGIACATACATSSAEPIGAPSAPEAETETADASTPTDAGGDSARGDAASSPTDASSPTPDAAPQPSACGGAGLVCDPLADTGCPGGQHCMVILDSTTKKRVVCQAAGTTEPLGSPGGIAGDCTKNPCTVGHACFAALGVCVRVCDPTAGTQPLPGHAGRASSPACATAYGKDCNAGVTGGAITCFGVCDTVTYSPGL